MLVSGLKYFSQLPDVRGMVLCSDGESVASIIRIDTKDAKGAAVQVTNLKTKSKKIVLYADNTQHFVDRIYWKDKNLLIVEVHFPVESNVFDKIEYSQILVVNIENGEVDAIDRDMPNIVDTLPQDPEHLLLSVYPSSRYLGRPRSLKVVKVNIKSGAKKTIQAYLDDRLAIFKVNLKDKNLKRELVYSSEKFDVRGSLIHSRKNNEAIGIAYTEDGGTEYFDPDLKKLQDQVDKALAGKRNYIYSFSDNMEKFLIFSTGPQESGTYFIGTRNPTKLDAIAYAYKDLVPEVLNTVKYVEYAARDGLKIDGYLTLPKSKKASNLSTILLPHGGSIGRDNDGFDYWAQYLATKGYAVLQMNFRGSAGKGLKFRSVADTWRYGLRG